ncbi:lytic transglycosylase domain-containing protein [Desulfobacterium sp. N47]|uniref:LysM domain-containing protein n=1 Tax=uncultured Desulfobacterium sp. TaxID=201089 RepID=E1YBC4_9BACT|nr:hypothetical protein N47_C18590 [uncultured Desulfobacterium sp.]
MYRNCKKLLLILCVFLFSANAGAANPEQSPSFYPDFTVIPGGKLTFCGEVVPLELQDVKERFEKEILLSAWDRAQVFLWLKRSSRYLPHIEKILKENGMPDDLKYIAVAESALRPNATSNKSAVGYWQFIRSTGLTYGLTIDGDKDERRNFFTSTQAAVSYLKQLNSMLGSWTLAAAGYNMGEEGLLAEIHEQETNDFYKLYLYEETQRYIFRILAIKLIMQNPARYGFRLEDKDYYPPLSFGRVDIECSDKIPIMIIAKAADTTYKDIKDLNPEIRGHFLQKGNHTIIIPKNSLEGFISNYEKLVENFLSGKSRNVYIVKKGDTVFSIAKMFDVPALSISIWNDLGNKLSIKAGDHLLVYQKESKPGE